MRVGRLVRFGLGLAAVSGAVACMSGDALAADSPSPVAAEVAPAASSQVPPSQASPAPAATDDSGNKLSSDTVSQTQASGTSGPVDSAKADPKDQGGVGTDPTADSRAKAQVSAVQAADPVGVGSLPTKEAGTPLVAQHEAESPAIVVFHAARLRIQPTITSRPVAESSDLAGSLPSAPVQHKLPAPAKSNGALGALRAVLAGVVVPQLFVSPTVAILRGSLLAVYLLPLLLLGSLFMFSFGLWLRRGGFVNAARSDAPTNGFTSTLFATPHVLDYVTMPPRRHSPIFVVAENNIHTQIQFSTLSERRTRI
jgi:hypothetical protein